MSKQCILWPYRFGDQADIPQAIYRPSKHTYPFQLPTQYPTQTLRPLQIDYPFLPPPLPIQTLSPSIDCMQVLVPLIGSPSPLNNPHSSPDTRTNGHLRLYADALYLLLPQRSQSLDDPTSLHPFLHLHAHLHPRAHLRLHIS